MALRWFRRRPVPAPDPIAAYDDLVSDLSSEAAELRRAAATLITVRARLGRELSEMERVGGTLRERADRARAGGDARTADVLTAETALAAEAQRSRADRIRRLVAVDAARDEVERAHALAEVWREDREGSGG